METKEEEKVALTLTVKPLDIIASEADRKMMEEITQFVGSLTAPITETQMLLLMNDIECPTMYSKINHVKLQLAGKYYRVVDLFFSIKKKELEIKQKDREIEDESNDIKKDLLRLEQQQLVFSLSTEQAALGAVLKEARLYYEYYLNNGTEFGGYTPEKLAELDKEMWQEKAKNNPLTFEERYGPGLLKDVLGDKKYEEYSARRVALFGKFPREAIP